MTIYLSNAAKDAMLDAFETLLIAGGAPWIRIYEGTIPTDEGTAIGAQLVLAEFQLPADPFAASSTGSKAKAGTWSGTAGASADNARTGSFFRLYTNNTGAPGTCHKQGSVTATGGGGDMTLDDNAPNVGQTITVNTFTLTHDG